MCSGERGHIIFLIERGAQQRRGEENALIERVACKSSGARYREQRAAADRAGVRLKSKADVGRARDYKMAPRSCYVSIEIISTARSLTRPPAPARSTLTYTPVCLTPQGTPRARRRPYAHPQSYCTAASAPRESHPARGCRRRRPSREAPSRAPSS